jgi:type IV pilus assembly protein PilX
MIRQSPSRQRGAVLVIGLLLLVVMTVLGTAAMQSTGLQERMAGNARDRNLAFQAAEAALRDAEQFINSKVAPFEPFQASSFTVNGSTIIGLYNSIAIPAPSPNSDKFLVYDHVNQIIYDPPIAIPDPFSLDAEVADPAKTRAFGAGTGAAALPEVAAPPRYLIELLSVNCTGANDSALFRITARAQGANGNTVVTLQSRYRRGVSCGGGSSEAPTGGDDNATI